MTEISKEYGTALFMLACEKNAAKEYGKALSDAKAVFEEMPAYLTLLTSPSISLKERLAVIDQGFSDALPPDVVSYLKLLCEKGRLSCFYESAEAYQALLDASEQVVTAKVTSAVELNEQEKEQLGKKLAAQYHKEIILECNIDETLLGGLLVEIDGKVLDGTLKRRLRDIKEVMSQ